MMLADMGADVDQGREAARRRRCARLPRAARQRRLGAVPDPEPQQARHRAQPQAPRRAATILLRMVRDADVLTENYRTRHAREARPRLRRARRRRIRASSIARSPATAATARYADKGGFDLIAQGFAGLMSITGEPGGPPVKTGNSVADINAGILAVIGILAAYAHKLKTGEGQVVDTSLMEAALQQTYWHAAILFRDRRIARADRIGASADRAVPGVPRKRRLDQHRRREPGELGAHLRRARASRVARGPALPHQHRLAWRTCRR